MQISKFSFALRFGIYRNLYRAGTPIHDGLKDAIGFDSDIDSPMFVGLLGKGPSKYPTTIVKKENDYQAETRSYEYELNNKGLLVSESMTCDGYSYRTDYTYSSGSRAESLAAGSEKVKPVKNRRYMSLFGRKK